MFEKKLGEIRPNQFITTYGPGAIMDAVHDSLTVLDIEYWNANNIGQEIRDSRLASFMNVRHVYYEKEICYSDNINKKAEYKWSDQMEAAQRIRLIRIIEKMERNSAFSNKLGIKNTSEYLSEKEQKK